MEQEDRKVGGIDQIRHGSGDYRSYHTLLKIDGQDLYTRGLPWEQQAMVEEAQANGTID